MNKNILAILAFILVVVSVSICVFQQKEEHMSDIMW